LGVFGPAAVTITVTDSLGATATNSASTIFRIFPALTITTTQAQILNGLLGAPYGGVTFIATGGIGAFTWVAPGASTPPCPVSGATTDLAGLTLSAGGVLSGTPNATSALPNFFKPTICVFDVGSASTLPGFTTAAYTFDVMNDFAYAAGTGVTNSVEVINTSAAPSLTGTIPLLTPLAAPNGVAITPNGRFAIVTENATSKVAVIDTITNTLVTEQALPATCTSPAGAAVNPDGIHLYIACDGGTNEVLVLDAVALTTTSTVTDLADIATIGAASAPDSIACRDTSRCYVTLSAVNQIAILDNVLLTQVGSNFTLQTGVNGSTTPLELIVASNTASGTKFYAYIAKNAGNKPGVDVVDVTSDSLALVGAATINTGAASGVALSPGTNRVYVSLPAANQYTILNNAVATPAVIVIGAPNTLPYNLPDPKLAAGAVTPRGIVIPPLAAAPALVFFTLNATSQIAVVNDALTLNSAHNAFSPFSATATSAPSRFRGIPIPQ